jgi:ATP-binding cassette, subfamily B, bacterial
VRGLPGVDALGRLLQLRGRSVARQELIEACRGDGSGEVLSAELEGRGIRARLARVRATHLRHLELPTLVELKDGTWLVLIRRRGRRWHAEGRDGAVEAQASVLAEAISGQVLDLTPGLPEGQDVWRRLVETLLRHRRLLVEVGLASVLMQLLALLPPQLTRLAVDRAFPEGAPSLLGLVAAGVLCAAAMQAAVGWVRESTVLYLKARLESSMGRSLLSHVLRLPFPLLQRLTVGRRLQAFAALDYARDLVTERALGAALDGVTASLYIALMGTIAPLATFFVIAAALGMGLLAAVVGDLQARAQRRATDAVARQRGWLVEMLSGVATLKVSAAEPVALRRWIGHLQEEIRIALQRQRLGLWTEVGLETLRQGLLAALLVVGGRAVLRGEATAGQLLAFVQMSGGFLGAVLGLAAAYTSFAVLRPQVAEMRALTATPPRPRSRVRAGAELAGSVRLDNVWFRYEPDGPWILENFSMAVTPGEKRRLGAPSGAGKTTILRLVAGLYAPDQGKVSVDGRDPAAASAPLIYLPQVVELYGGSLLENLRILSGNAPRARLLEASRASGLDAFVSSLPMDYETVVPPGGGTLSGGQRQLLALTAAMASERTLLLLDEAMANLDTMARALVRGNPWFRDKTVIYASHDGAPG